MPNMSPTKNPMPSQDPLVRNKNFLEVATGYTVEIAQDEAASAAIDARLGDFIQAPTELEPLIERLLALPHVH